MSELNEQQAQKPQKKLPNGWEWVALGDISSVISKGTTPTSLGHSFTNEGVPFLRAEDVIGQAVNPEGVKFYISVDTHNFLLRSQLQPHDLLITIAGTLGRVGYVADDAPQMNCNQAVAFIRIKREIADVQYLCFACQNLDTIAPLLSLKAGGAIQNLNLQQIRSLQVPLPPLSEQKRITSILGEQMDAVNKARIAALEQLQIINDLPASLLRQAMGGKL